MVPVGVDGKVGPAADYPIEALVSDMDVGELDGAAGDEVAVADFAGGRVLVLGLEEGGQVRQIRDHPIGGIPRLLVAADMDRDGVLDLLVGDLASSTILVLFRPAAADGGRQLLVEAGLPPTALLGDDLDVDGKADLAVATAEALRVLRGDGAGGFSNARTFWELGGAGEMIADDLDADGAIDLVVRGRQWVSVRYAPLGAVDPVGEELNGDWQLTSTRAEDVDGDDRMDLVSTAAKPFPVVIVNRGEPGGGFGKSVFYLTGSDPRSLVSLT